MSHHVYTTESIILKREPQDSSAYYYILTKDLGLIHARAQGVREAKSRLKGTLQEFSFSTIAYVHGKAGWKITTAIPERNFFTETKSIEVRKIMAHIGDSLIRLIPGEEKSKDIFMAVEKGFSSLIENEKESSLIEVIILVRILHALGLLAKDDDTSPLLQNYSDFSTSILSSSANKKAPLIKAINKGFKESQL